MKKLLLLTLSLILLLGAASCGSKKNEALSTPHGAAQVYMDYLTAGDYVKFAKGIAVNPDSEPALVDQTREFIADLYKTEMEGRIAEHGAVSKTEIISALMLEDESEAIVTVEYHYEDESTEEVKFTMWNMDGIWQIYMGQ